MPLWTLTPSTSARSVTFAATLFLARGSNVPTAQIESLFPSGTARKGLPSDALPVELDARLLLLAKRTLAN
jgi:hypothetical protein